MWKAPQAIAARPSSTSCALAVDGAGDLGAVEQGAVGDAVDVGLVVLADVGGVGARDRALVAHPGDRHRGVEAAGEGDADAFAGREGGEDLAHRFPSFVCGCWWFETLAPRCSTTGGGGGLASRSRGRPGPRVVVRRRRRRSGSREITSTVSSPAMVPSTSPSSALSRAEARKLAAPGGVRSTTRLALASAETSSSSQPAGQPALAGGGLARRDRGAVAALGRHGVHQRRRRRRAP